MGLEYLDDGGAVVALTFGEVDARADRMAAELAARGLRRGDRLCVHLPNGAPFLDIFLACVRLGAVLVPINTLYRERELRHIISDAEPVATVVMPNAGATYPAGTTLWGLGELSAGAASRPASRSDVSLDGDRLRRQLLQAITGANDDSIPAGALSGHLSQPDWR